MPRPAFAQLAVIIGSLAATIAAASPAAADYLAASLGPNFVDGSVERFDDDGNLLEGQGIANGTAGLGMPQGITIGPDGNIYVSSVNNSTGAGEILFFDPSGAPLSHSGGQVGLFATLPFNPPAEEGGDPTPPSPARLKFGPDGNLYVADMAGTTVRVFDGTTGVQLADAATGLAAPTGLTFGPDGALYVGNFNDGVVYRVQEGMKQPFIEPTLAGPYTPSSLLWQPSGNLLVVDVIGNQILEYDDSGQFVSQFAVIPPEIPDELPPGVNYRTNSPSDIIFDPDGNLALGVLGLTYPPTTPGAILKYGLDGGDPLDESFVSGVLGIGAIAWIAPEDAIAGDFDGNQMVEPADYTKWKNDFGKFVAKGGGGDGNGNGIVDAADFTVWRDGLGHSLGSGAGSIARITVPEPSSLLLAALCLLPLAGGRMIRRGSE
jgi:hypothetical protein